MVELRQNSLVFSFPEVHRKACLTVGFQRTLRIPDNDQEYPLPPGLGQFPLRHVDDFAARLPESWLRRGGVMLPMYQSEAMWMSFSSREEYPFIVKVAAGRINAVTGEEWSLAPRRHPRQDYLPVPGQPWLDGFAVEEGIVRQFVAMPLGAGYTAEEQLTGRAEHGGVQIAVYPMREDVYRRELGQTPGSPLCYSICESAPDMGMAPGGRIVQSIAEDDWELDDYRLDAGARCFVHLANSAQWREVTGEAPPTKPPTARDYTARGLPWFDYYDEEARPLPGSGRLAGMKSVSERARGEGDRGVLREHDDRDFPIDRVRRIGPRRRGLKTRDGDW